MTFRFDSLRPAIIIIFLTLNRHRSNPLTLWSAFCYFGRGRVKINGVGMKDYQKGWPGEGRLLLVWVTRKRIRRTDKAATHMNLRVTERHPGDAVNTPVRTRVPVTRVSLNSVFRIFYIFILLSALVN